MSPLRVAAIDLGAASGRIVIGYRTDRGFGLREVHRFANGVNGVDARRLYQATGIAPQPINTVFQLMAERDLDRARHAVLVPDLMTYWLSGQLGTELTNASTTGLLDSRAMRWADQIGEALAVRVIMFPPLRTAGEVAGLRALVDVQDPAFLPPGGMTARIAGACLRVSGAALPGRAEILRCILDSMAVAIRQAVRDAVRLSGRAVPAGSVPAFGS